MHVIFIYRSLFLFTVPELALKLIMLSPGIIKEYARHQSDVNNRYNSPTFGHCLRCLVLLGNVYVSSVLPMLWIRPPQSI